MIDQLFDVVGWLLVGGWLFLIGAILLELASDGCCSVTPSKNKKSSARRS